MQIVLIILLSLCCKSTLDAQSFFDTTYFSNGKIRKYGKYDKNKDCLLEYRYYPNGNICEIDQYDSSALGNRLSTKGFNINGSIAVNFSVLGGLANGLFEQYYSDGKIKIRGQYYHGFKSGKWIEYFPTGEIKVESLYSLTKEDSIFGRKKTLYDQDFLSSTLNDRIEWGEDTSKEVPERYITVTKIDFRYLESKEPVTRKKYDRNGKLIESVIIPKTKSSKNIP